MVTMAAEPGRLGDAFDWLGVERAWTRTRGNPQVVIGIVDEGVQLDHPLLGPNIQRHHSHHDVPAGTNETAGTHAAGIAAGRHSDVEHFSGVAPAARLLPVRFTRESGRQAFDLAQAIEYAVEMGACIINVSGLAELSAPRSRRAIQYAAARNTLVVCAASERREPAPPDEDMPNLLRVLSVDESLRPMAAYPEGAADLAAPGFARVPRWRASGHAQEQNPAYGAPYVSGCAALVKSLNPGWGYHELKEHLIASAQPHPSLVGPCRHGALLHVANAVLGPLELPDAPLFWSSLHDAEIRWNLRYRSALCVRAVALFRPQGDEHWRELAFGRAAAQRMVVPATALRRSVGTLRLACRDSNFHSQDVALTIG